MSRFSTRNQSRTPLAGDSGCDRLDLGWITRKGVTEPVTVLRNFGFVRGVADRRANLADELRQAAVGHERGGPDVVVELGLRQCARAALDQELQQVERFGRNVKAASFAAK